ncbi:prephenate dehydrogenase [Gordonia sp. VNK1]|jgi:prephenate dehydrogenase|uniref:prephenate dehydrogenase n=1 Tax=Gordonia oleivorans TaxID=3156618 RepID=UPI0032B51DC2
MCKSGVVTERGNRPVCILGLGLIGGSMMRALAASGRATFGYNRSATGVDAATTSGHDASTDLDATLRRAATEDAVIVLATPVTTIEPIVAAIAEHAPACLLTDVISVKQPVAEILRRVFPQARYVGGHPMAGTSRSGWEAADPDLFGDAMWMVTTEDDTDAADWTVVADLALSLGAAVVPAAADAHDRAVAAISHLPHLTAAATAAVGAGESDLALRLAAGSFRDGTRVAGSAPQLQRAMIEANAVAVLNVLSETIDRLIAARDELRDHGTTAVLVDDGHRARMAYEAMNDRPRVAITDVEVGAPGWQKAMRGAAHRGHVWLG